MNELIKIEKKEGIETVNARELHEFLGVQTQYKDWIRSRIEKFGFIENQDYIAIAEKKATAQGNQSEYKVHYISIDMAKELSMVENNEKGRQARQYFIAMEKKAKTMKISGKQSGAYLRELGRLHELGTLSKEQVHILLGLEPDYPAQAPVPQIEAPAKLPDHIAKQVYAVAAKAIERENAKNQAVKNNGKLF